MCLDYSGHSILTVNKGNTEMSYHQFKDEDGQAFGSFEVFHSTGVDAGWYWQAGFPGCLGDAEAVGPFETESEAIEDALNI
jgi:hypothetical protein